MCRTGERVLAVPLPRVIETMRPLPVEPFAGGPAFLSGLARIRGEVVPVLDTGVLLGATSGAQYGQATERLLPGDLLVLHTDGLLPRRSGSMAAADSANAVRRLLELGPRFAQARTPQECVRIVVEELGAPEREDDACVLIAKFH